MTIKTLATWMSLFFASTLALAQSPFDGTWKINLESAKLPEKPLHYLLQDGNFKCVSCEHRHVDINADGKDHPIAADAAIAGYVDHMSIRVVDPNTIVITEKVKGKVMSEETDKVSGDGQSMTQKNVDYSEDRSKPTTEEWTYTRVSAGPAGSHHISGEWRATKITNVSANDTTATFQSTPNGLKFSDSNGGSWDAKFDGKQYPQTKDPGHTMVSLKRIDDHTVEATQIRAGKVVGIYTVRISPDGKTMTSEWHDPSVPGSNETVTAEKQ